MPARGAVAQAKKAQKKAEKRAARIGAREQSESARFKVCLTELLHFFATDLEDTVQDTVTAHTKRMKKEREELILELEDTRRLADDRRAELDGQVERARAAEEHARNLTAFRDRDRADGQKEIKGLKDIIEEQGSTIKAQAVALREANRKNKG